MKAVRLRFHPKTNHNGFHSSIINLCMDPLLSTFFEFLWRPPGSTPDLVEEIVGVRGSRSATRAHEHDSSQLVDVLFLTPRPAKLFFLLS